MSVSPLEMAKERLSIPELWERCGLPGQPRRHCRSPFREDRSASFSIYANGRRWRDFATGEDGDAADFLARAQDISPEEGIRRLIKMAGVCVKYPNANSSDRSVRDKENFVSPTSPVVGLEHTWNATSADRTEKAAKRARWPQMEPCTRTEIETIAKLRGLSVEGVALAVERGLLYCAESREGRAWILTDSRRVSAQARRLDGQPWERIRAKAWTLPGSEAAWPIGLPEAAAYPGIALVEGGPDLLAALHLAVTQGTADRMAPVVMLGAGQCIPREALPFFARKRVRIFLHADEAGQQAGQRWHQRIKAAAQVVDGYLCEGGDLNDLALSADGNHAEAMSFLSGLPVPPRRESAEDKEARRIAGELMKMYRAGVLTGPDDPEAAVSAAIMRTFRATYRPNAVTA